MSGNFDHVGLIKLIKETPEYDINPPGDSEDAEFRAIAKIQGKLLLQQWTDARADAITTICGMFNEEGKPKNPVSATTFSDLYKFTMAPIMFYTNKIANKECNVTFGIDLRDRGFRNALKEDKALESYIAESLKDLANRPFNREVFNHVISGPRNTIFDVKNTKEDNISLICGSTENPRMLAQVVHEFGEMPSDEHLDGNVHVFFYFKGDKTYDAEGTESGVHFIEAVGPWHLVTWLETTMMQCVYEAKLRYDLNKQAISYAQWLKDAMLRCAMSICYTRLVQEKYKRPIPSLFAGRRTGGLLFLMLQNLMFTDCFTSAAPSAASSLALTNTAAITVDSSKPVPCIGTSASDVHYMFTKLGLPCVPMVGTNAHEMRMVFSIVYAALDVMPSNPTHIPYSQIISDYLYYELVWKKLPAGPPPAPSPALPDTLGTRTYLQAATNVKYDEGRTIFDLVTSARQDSGELPNFLQAMNDYGYTKASMASEIDSTKSLLESATVEIGPQKYALYGAGGFFGESIKVWNKTLGDKAANSMAVKAVRVESKLNGSGSEKNILTEKAGLYFNIEGDKIKGYPVKLGDTVEVSKLSVDRNLGTEKILEMKTYFLKIRSDAEQAVKQESTYTINQLFTYENGTIPEALFAEGAAAAAEPAVPQGGRRRKNKTKMVKVKKAVSKRYRKHKTRRVRRKA